MATISTMRVETVIDSESEGETLSDKPSYNLNIFLDKIGRVAKRVKVEKRKYSEPSNGVELDNYINIFKSSEQANVTDSDIVRWKGYVTKIDETSFFANLEDLSDRTTYEIGEFSLRDVPNEDREIFRLGAVFYLSIGHITNSKGQVKKEKILRFQRLSNWSEEEYDASEDRAQKLFDTITWE